MPLTIRALTEIPHLRTRLHAGADGRDREIAWAHSIELRRPWEWLERGDLLMTVGLGVPALPDEQVAYVENLAAVGVSGVAIGEDMQAPELSPEMLAAADRLALPILYTAYEVPFVQISRTVAAAGRGPEHTRLVKSVRIYDRVRAAVVRGSEQAELMAGLEEEIGARLFVCSNDGDTVLFAGTEALPAAARAAFSSALEERDGSLPGILRLPVGGETLIVVPVPTRRPCSLLALPASGDAPAYALLQHVATVAALEVERLWASREELRRLGSETLAHLLDSRISPATAAAQLRSHGLEDETLVMLAASRLEGLERGSQLHHLLADNQVPHLLLRRSDVLFALLPGEEGVVESVTDLVDEAFRVGVSDTFQGLENVSTASREARWALDAAQSEARRVVAYGERTSLFGPRSIGEARAAVDRVIGPLLAYDSEHGTQLVQSLATFLRCNRSWKKATPELFVHKQTLVYRMRRVEELTGRKLNETGDVADLWFAVKALELLR